MMVVVVVNLINNRTVLLLSTLVIILCCFTNLVSGNDAGGGGGGWWFSSMIDKVSDPIKNIVSQSQSQPQPQSQSPTQRENNNNDNGDNNNKQEGNYQAMCLMKRKKAWKSNPTLHYFSHKLHTPNSLECSSSIKFNLETTLTEEEEEEEEGNYDDDDDGGLNYSTEESYNLIKSQLIDSELYNPNLNTYFMIHGFLASWNSSNWMCYIKDKILNNTEANVFIVDWSGGSKPMLPIDYSQSVTNTKYVADSLSLFLKTLLSISGQENGEKVQFIGHSLGAHISGFVGYSLNGSIGRITALDPAGPCFKSKSLITEAYNKASDEFLDESNYRLSPKDAKLVIALHTDTTLFGLNENCAHFDVWVNGGSKQPKCPSLKLAENLQNLLTGNIDFSSLGKFPDLTCAHSYSHDIFDILIPITGNAFNKRQELSSSSSSLKVVAATKNLIDINFENKNSIDKCYPIAYECRSWNAFKSGECGYCQDGDVDCIFIGGLGLNYDEFLISNSSQLDYYGNERETVLKSTFEGVNNFDKSKNTDNNDDDDDKFNGDNDDGEIVSSDVNSEGKHFIKTGPNFLYCLYAYQIIIAIKSLENNELNKKNYYLQFPLDDSGYLIDSNNNNNNERLRDRLVQISHRIEHEAPAYLKIRDKFTIRMNDFGLNLTKTDYDYDYETSGDNLDYYTALITFNSTSNCNDSLLDNTKNNYLLCKPIEKINQARLWSSTKERLEQVQWVALNYMNGITEKMRFKYSQFFKLTSTEDIEKFDDNNNNNNMKPSIDELSVNSNKSESSLTSSSMLNNLRPLKLARTVLSPIDCAISSMNPNEMGSSETNFKCGRASSELKYSVGLRPI